MYICLCVSLCVCVCVNCKNNFISEKNAQYPRGCLYLFLFVCFISFYIFIYINLFFLALSLLVVNISVFRVVYKAQCVVQRVQFWVDYWCGDIFLSFK